QVPLTYTIVVEVRHAPAHESQPHTAAFGIGRRRDAHARVSGRPPWEGFDRAIASHAHKAFAHGYPDVVVPVAGDRCDCTATVASDAPPHRHEAIAVEIA